MSFRLHNGFVPERICTSTVMVCSMTFLGMLVLIFLILGRKAGYKTHEYGLQNCSLNSVESYKM